MELFISYIIKSSGVLSVLLIYYWFFLRQQTFFTLNRFYLLAALLLGVAIPFISVEITSSFFPEKQLHPEINTYAGYFSNKINAIENGNRQTNSPGQGIFLVIYFTGFLFFLARYLVALTQILSLIHRNPRRSNHGIHVIKLKEQQPVFSFFNYLFIYKLPSSKDARRKIFEHEKLHIRQLHSLDLIITELICVVNWFNPFVWLFKRIILENHEYIADRQVIRRYHTGGYPELLVQQAFKGLFSFSHYFACSNLKKRIIMMTKKQSSKFQVIRYVPAVLLAGVLFYGLSCNITTAEATEFTVSTPSEAVTPQNKATSSDTTLPKFMEGDISQWINKHLNRPAEIARGKNWVFVNFIVDADGAVTKAKIIKSDNPELDSEALRVINSMPRWTPAKTNGKNIATSINIVVNFNLAKNVRAKLINAK